MIFTLFANIEFLMGAKSVVLNLIAHSHQPHIYYATSKKHIIIVISFVDDDSQLINNYM